MVSLFFTEQSSDFNPIMLRSLYNSSYLALHFDASFWLPSWLPLQCSRCCSLFWRAYIYIYALNGWLDKETDIKLPLPFLSLTCLLKKKNNGMLSFRQLFFLVNRMWIPFISLLNYCMTSSTAYHLNQQRKNHEKMTSFEVWNIDM